MTDQPEELPEQPEEQGAQPEEIPAEMPVLEDDDAAYSSEHGFSLMLAELKQSAELIIKCSEKHSEYQAIAEKLNELQASVYTNQDAIFAENFGSGAAGYDKEPLLIKLYRQTHAQIASLLNDPCWQGSTFLQNIQKHLREVLLIFEKAIDEDDPTHIKESKEVVDDEDDKDYTKVYVSLYCVSGNLEDWEKILNNIDKQVISRPILTEEAHVQSLIRSKDNPRNQAYAVLRVLETNVIRKTTADRPDHDAQGHEMVSIKDTRIDKESILYFVHENQHYIVEHGLLVAK